MKKFWGRWVLISWGACMLWGCGGGVPIKLVIDEFSMEIDLDAAMSGAHEQLVAQGLLDSSSPGLPEIWPENLPEIRYRTLISAPPIPIDLTPEPADPNATGDGTTGEAAPQDDKYASINKVADAVERIEINKFVLRLEENALSMNLPELRLQVADSVDASEDDRLAWRTVGRLPATETAGVVEDLTFEFVPSGESYLNQQLSDEKKELAMRLQGRVDVDLKHGARLPSGKAVARVLLVATFFIRPEGVL